METERQHFTKVKKLLKFFYFLVVKNKSINWMNVQIKSSLTFTIFFLFRHSFVHINIALLRKLSESDFFCFFSFKRKEVKTIGDTCHCLNLVISCFLIRYKYHIYNVKVLALSYLDFPMRRRKVDLFRHRIILQGILYRHTLDG